jgi:hypothetical protein
VQSLHDADWRLDRILSLESASTSKAESKCWTFMRNSPKTSAQEFFIQFETYNRNEKTLHKLAVQEGRFQAAAEAKSPSPATVGFEFSTPEIAPTTENTASQPLDIAA